LRNDLRAAGRILSRPSELQGLSTSEAKARLRAFGPNVLVRGTTGARLRELLATFADPMAIMLGAAAGVYLALGDQRDGIVLLIALVPVLGVDVLMEARSRRALQKLAAAVAAKARVVRDGNQIEVPTADIVPGDVLVFGEGDVLHADGIVRLAANLAMDESQLTGESEPQEKLPYEGPSESNVPSQSRFYAGSLVSAGHGFGEVTTTGERTRYGALARLVSEADTRPTALQRKTAHLVRWLVGVAAIVSAAIFILRLWEGTPPGAAFLYAITLAMSAVSEELVLVFSLFFSIGAWRLSKVGVLVRRLACVETLGSTTIICLDKTGTLTAGSFALQSHLPLGDGVANRALLEAAALACEPHPADSMERAILDHCRAHRVDVAELHSRWRLIHDYPFDVLGKHMSHVWARSDDGERHHRQACIVAKGALEGILEHCELAPAEMGQAQAANRELAEQGMRVLAVAGRLVSVASSATNREDKPLTYGFSGIREHDERGLRLYGLLGFRDPLRPEVPAAVAECQAAGIRLKLITGDHPLTAHAIAEAAGIIHDDAEIVTGDDLDRMPAERFREVARSSSIFARILPEQKYAIVDALMRAGEVVAMTGDGINDAPALRRADIGVAMGRRGTEVARAAADLVLLQDDFRALVATVREGRHLFENIQNAVRYLVAFKLTIVGLAFSVPLLGMPILLIPVDLVWLELIIHPVSALAFEGEPASHDVMRRAPRDPAAPIIPRRAAFRSVLSGILLAAAALALYATRLGRGQDYARGAAMALVVTGSLLLVWAEIAGERRWWKTPLPRTARFWSVCIAVGASLPVFMNVAPLAALLRVAPISISDWLIVGALAVAVVGWRAA
jgi:P-type Ca2+ transporter type 2C